MPLKISKLQEGTFFPSLLEPRKRSEQALLAVIQVAYVKGVSTRKVDDLVQALGLSGVDKSKVSRITKGLDELVHDFRHRPLEDEYPYVWLDALYLKVRQNHRVVSLAVVVAVGVDQQGDRTILGFDVGASEQEAFWLQFLHSLVKRGLKGVQLVISGADKGLKTAVNTVFAGASWQRYRVHFVRNVLAHIPKGDKAMMAAAVRTIFAQPDHKAAGQQLRYVAETISTRQPKASQLLLSAEEYVLAFMAFPRAHWTRIYSTNILERLNKEVKRRTKVVEIFPDIPSVIRLVGTLLAEADDEWQISRRYSSKESMQQLYEPDLDLLAKLGDDRERFPSVASLQALAGTCPVTMASGKRKRVIFRHACDHDFRQIDQQWARCSLRKSVWAVAYWQQIRPRCASDHDAYRRLANRWLAVLWKLWHSRELYDETYHLQQRCLRSQPLA